MEIKITRNEWISIIANLRLTIQSGKDVEENKKNMMLYFKLYNQFNKEIGCKTTKRDFDGQKAALERGYF